IGLDARSDAVLARADRHPGSLRPSTRPRSRGAVRRIGIARQRRARPLAPNQRLRGTNSRFEYRDCGRAPSALTSSTYTATLPLLGILFVNATMDRPASLTRSQAG